MRLRRRLHEVWFSGAEYVPKLPWVDQENENLLKKAYAEGQKFGESGKPEEDEIIWSSVWMELLGDIVDTAQTIKQYLNDVKNQDMKSMLLVLMSAAVKAAYWRGVRQGMTEYKRGRK